MISMEQWIATLVASIIAGSCTIIAVIFAAILAKKQVNKYQLLKDKNLVKDTLVQELYEVQKDYINSIVFLITTQFNEFVQDSKSSFDLNDMMQSFIHPFLGFESLLNKMRIHIEFPKQTATKIKNDYYKTTRILLEEISELVLSTEDELEISNQKIVHLVNQTLEPYTYLLERIIKSE